MALKTPSQCKPITPSYVCCEQLVALHIVVMPTYLCANSPRYFLLITGCYPCCSHADVSITTHGPNETPVLLSYLPFFHVYGMLGVLIVGLAVGATVVTLPRYSPNELLSCIEKFKVRLHRAM